MQAGALILSFFILFDSSMIYLIYTTDIPPCFFFLFIFLSSMYHEQAHITAMKVFCFILFFILFGDFKLNTEIDSKNGMKASLYCGVDVEICGNHPSVS